MKKHPVDDLFKNKLSGLEKHPSSDAWNRIVLGQEAGQKKFPVWIWYVAAGVAMAVLAGYSVWFNKWESHGPQMARIEVTKPPGKSLLPSENKLDKIVPLIVYRKAESPDSEISIELTSIVPKENPKEAEQMSKNLITEDSVQLSEKQASIGSDIDVPNPVSSQERIVENQPVTKFDTNSNRTTVVRVTYEDDSLEEPKTSRFTRVFRQLKNARAGEHVDWEEVGFNPKSILARVDSKRKQ